MWRWRNVANVRSGIIYIISVFHSAPVVDKTLSGSVFCGGANFRKSEKALRINSQGFKFSDSNPVQGRGTAQTVI